MNATIDELPPQAAELPAAAVAGEEAFAAEQNARLVKQDESYFRSR